MSSDSVRIHQQLEHSLSFLRCMVVLEITQILIS